MRAAGSDQRDENKGAYRTKLRRSMRKERGGEQIGGRDQGKECYRGLGVCE
jgi:hypothetical protein